MTQTNTPRNPQDTTTRGNIFYGDEIDAGSFEQILEMDDDDERDFSKTITIDFLEQTEQTFSKMDAAIKEKDLDELGALGHFLKGSAATMGLVKVSKCCERIQHFGQRKDASGDVDEPSDEKSLSNIKSEIPKVRQAFDVVAARLRVFYGLDEEE